MKRCKHCHRRPVRAPGKHDCHCCNKRLWRKRNPLSAQYSRLKESARKRDIEFTIARAEFEEFAVQCDYIATTGNFGHSLCVDRKDAKMGYVPGNIQPLSREENTRKQMKEQEQRLHAGYAWQRQRS